jgi:hypothetical protein
MNYKGMKKHEKDFCLDVLCDLYDSKIRKCHPKSKARQVIKSAFRAKFGTWPEVSESVIETLRKRAWDERRIKLMSEPNGKGLVCTMGIVNADPAIVDHVGSIVAQQNKIGSTIRNLRENGVYPLAVIMLPEANLSERQITETVEPIQQGNIQIARECQKTRQLSEIKIKQIAYITDENGIDHEVSRNQIQQ